MSKDAKNGPKNGKKWQHLKNNWHRSSGSKLPHKMRRFHAMFGYRDTHFQSFLAKISIFLSKFQPNQRNYLVLLCYVGHFYKH